MLSLGIPGIIPGILLVSSPIHRSNLVLASLGPIVIVLIVIAQLGHKSNGRFRLQVY